MVLAALSVVVVVVVVEIEIAVAIIVTIIVVTHIGIIVLHQVLKIQHTVTYRTRVEEKFQCTLFEIFQTGDHHNEYIIHSSHVN